jgi:two-component system NtrC family sensor kinase
MIPVLCNWLAFGVTAAPKLASQEAAAIIMVGASLLVFRTFRERYLLVWIVGWLAYFVSRWTLQGSADDSVSRTLIGISHGAFVLAICLFAASILIYTHARKLLLPLFLGTLALVGYAFTQAVLWPNSELLRQVLEVSYRLVALATGFWLLRYRWGRWEIGPWLLAGTIVFFHLDWADWNVYVPQEYGLGTDLLCGLSMLFIVFDDSRMHMRRLAAINSLTTGSSRAESSAPMLNSAMEELTSLMLAKSAWFRMIEGDGLIIAQHTGLSQLFLQERSRIGFGGTLGEVLREGSPRVIRTKSAPDDIRPFMKIEKFHLAVIVPVAGKKSPIGTLCLGTRRRLTYTPDDMEFLTTAARQLGLAAENLRLVEQILRSHRQWSNTFDSIQDLVLVHDSEWRVIKANNALLTRLDQAPADVVGKTCEEVLPSVFGAWQSCPYCRGEEEGFHEGTDQAFGGYSMVSTSSYTDQGTKQKGTIHVIRDITDRREAEEKYRRLFDQVQEGVFMATPDGKLIDCNEAFVRMLGYEKREELLALNIDTQVYASPEQRKVFREEVERQNYVRNFEVTIRRKDGVLLTVLESTFVTRDADGKIERYQGFLLDITEKKHAEDEIRRRNRELNALNAMAVIATQSFDLDEILNLTLRQVISLLGVETGQIYLAQEDGTFRCRAAWGQRNADRNRRAEVRFADGFGDLVTRSRAEVLTHEYIPHLPPSVADFICADGLNSCIWVLLWGKDNPVGLMGICTSQNRGYSPNDEGLLVAIGRQLATTIEKVRLYEETSRAYEDLRRTQEQLLQSEKMSAVGQLISGVAHELNNPLTAILGYAQLLENEGLSSRAEEFVGKLFKQAQRTHRVVQNLLSFARQRKPVKQEVDVCRVLDDTLVLRDYDLRVNQISVERQFQAGIPAVMGDAHQLEQVFLNIINNSLDAMLEMGKGGSLLIGVESKDELISVIFQDSGPGLKEPHRIFEPFYTTKDLGKGTGLGLSICYGIIQEHGGEISARNAAGGGAVVEVRLPSAGVMTIPQRPSTPKRREGVIEGSILLVEDEEAVLEFERDVLAGAGAEVGTLMSSDQLKKELLARSFDALIINGALPGGSASEIYRWLQSNRPGMEKHVLFTFSTLTEPEVRTFLQENNIPHLVKPFEVADLISQGRRLLQKTQSAAAGTD